MCLYGYTNVSTIKVKQCQKDNTQFSINVNTFYYNLSVITIPCMLSNKKYALLNAIVLSNIYSVSVFLRLFMSAVSVVLITLSAKKCFCLETKFGSGLFSCFVIRKLFKNVTLALSSVRIRCKTSGVISTKVETFS